MNPEKLRYVTRHFYDLQGLKLVVLGVLFASPRLQFTQQWAALALLALQIAVIIYLWRRVGRYYERRFGDVRTERGWRQYALVFGLLAALAVGLLLEVTVDLPFVAVGVVLGGYLCTLCRPRLGLRMYYAAFGLIFIALSFAPPALVEPASSAFDPLLFALVTLTGPLLIIGGLLDHLTLVRVLDAASDAPAAAATETPEMEADHA
jgi:drug/metabolite transporter superfamily protein YnfA